MSLRSASRTNLPPRTWGGSVPQVSAAAWRRHPAWAAMPSVTSSDSKLVGLFAVWAESNFLALTATGNYTVDWGDGTTENVSTGVTAYHEYSFSTSSLANTNGPVTFTDAGDLVNRTAHGFNSGDSVAFWNIVTTTGITEGARYYVVNATANTFQISTTAGGSAVALTTDGSGTLLPYKQALVTVTPNGGTLTSINLNVRHNKTALQQYASGWLDIVVSGPDFNSTGFTLSASTPNVLHAQLQRLSLLNWGAQTSAAYLCNASYGLQNVAFPLGSNSVTSMSNMFNGCYSLTSVPLFNTALVTTMSSMFNGCNALTTVPAFDTAQVTTMSSMFYVCHALTTVPAFNTAQVTSMSYMFANCRALTSVSLFNTAQVTGMTYMFVNCYALTTVPLFNTALVTNMSYMFSGCNALTTVPAFNTAQVTNMSSMFSGCNVLTTVPLFNTALVTDTSSMFNACDSLTTVPAFNTALVTNMSSMFNSCYALTAVPLFNTALVTNMSSMFSNCYALTYLPAMSASGATSSSSYTSMFGGCTNLAAIAMTGFKYTFSVANCKLSSPSLDALYTALDTVSSQTITVSGNHGIAADTPTIATGKGWTVSGS